MSSSPHGANGASGANGTSQTTALPHYMLRTRERPITTEEVEASTDLRLGEFQHVPCLSISEARFIIDAVLEARKKAGKRYQETEVLQKMQNYVDTFARFKGRNQLDEVENLLIQRGQLDMFEKSQIANLLPGDAEETKTLVPSLGEKVDDDDLQQLMEDLSQVRDNVG